MLTGFASYINLNWLLIIITLWKTLAVKVVLEPHFQFIKLTIMCGVNPFILKL